MLTKKHRDQIDKIIRNQFEQLLIQVDYHNDEDYEISYIISEKEHQLEHYRQHCKCPDTTYALNLKCQNTPDKRRYWRASDNILFTATNEDTTPTQQGQTTKYTYENPIFYNYGYNINKPKQWLHRRKCNKQAKREQQQNTYLNQKIQRINQEFRKIIESQPKRGYPKQHIFEAGNPGRRKFTRTQQIKTKRIREVNKLK